MRPVFVLCSSCVRPVLVLRSTLTPPLVPGICYRMFSRHAYHNQMQVELGLVMVVIGG